MTKESTPPPVSPSPPRLCQIALTPTFEGYGFNLHTMKGKTGQFVGKIDPGSPAAEAGLKEGDRLLEVNGSDITNETHSQVVTRIKMVPGRTNLLVIDQEGTEWYDKHGIIVTSELPEVLIGSSGAVTVKEAESRSASSDSEEEDEGSDSEGEKNQRAELKHEEKKIENQAFVEELKTVTEKVLAEEETKAETTLSSLKEEDLEENVDSGTEDPHPVEEAEHLTENISSPDTPDGSHDDGKPIDEAIETSTPEPDNLASSSASESASVTSEVSTNSPKDAAPPSDAAVTTANEIAENQEEKEENASNASSSASSTTEEEETSPNEKMVPPKPEEKNEKPEDNADWVWDQPVAKKEVLPHPAPVASPTPRSPPDDGLDLPTSAAEMRRILSSRKRKDPRKEVMDARRKYDIIQAL